MLTFIIGSSVGSTSRLDHGYDEEAVAADNCSSWSVL